MNQIKEKLSGKNKEHIPNIAFRMMTSIMRIMDFWGNNSNKNFETLNLKKGQTVIDYGCGPARYIRNTSIAVGDSGKVIAVDIHPLAIKTVQAKIEKYNLNNVESVLANGYNTPIQNETADVVLALDMFHMIEQPTELLHEFSRVLKSDGVAIIEDGHQKRSETIRKIEKSNIFTIVQENKFHVRCKKTQSDK